MPRFASYGPSRFQESELSNAVDSVTRGASLSLIVAMDQRCLIGRDGHLPWRLPNDLAHFKRLTLGKTILMGRRTWDSLGRPLPGRENWVLSRDPEFAPVGARAFRSLQTALASHGHGELMVIGGAELYRQTLGMCRRIHLTRVLASLPARPGDVLFSELDEAAFRVTSEADHAADDRHAYPYRFQTLERPLAPSAPAANPVAGKLPSDAP